MESCLTRFQCRVPHHVKRLLEVTLHTRLTQPSLPRLNVNKHMAEIRLFQGHKNEGENWIIFEFTYIHYTYIKLQWSGVIYCTQLGREKATHCCLWRDEPGAGCRSANLRPSFLYVGDHLPTVHNTQGTKNLQWYHMQSYPLKRWKSDWVAWSWARNLWTKSWRSPYRSWRAKALSTQAAGPPELFSRAVQQSKGVCFTVTWTAPEAIWTLLTGLLWAIRASRTPRFYLAPLRGDQNLSMFMCQLKATVAVDATVYFNDNSAFLYHALLGQLTANQS